jgi:hypothetical protein
VHVGEALTTVVDGWDVVVDAAINTLVVAIDTIWLVNEINIRRTL